jgi:hypothetical protein
LEPSELDEILAQRPSLRGIILGFLAEYKFEKTWLSDKRISKIDRFSDHDRAHKSDLTPIYKGQPISIQVKSLQSNSVRQIDSKWIGTFQCDASDRRPVKLPNGDMVDTTCLVVGGFDLLAVNLFEFGKEWRFAFARNEALPRTDSKKYTADQQKYLLKTSMPISWPLAKPYEAEPFRLLDEIIREKTKSA